MTAVVPFYGCDTAAPTDAAASLPTLVFWGGDVAECSTSICRRYRLAAGGWPPNSPSRSPLRWPFPPRRAPEPTERRSHHRDSPSLAVLADRPCEATSVRHGAHQATVKHRTRPCQPRAVQRCAAADATQRREGGSRSHKRTASGAAGQYAARKQGRSMQDVLGFAHTSAGCMSWKSIRAPKHPSVDAPSVAALTIEARASWPEPRTGASRPSGYSYRSRHLRMLLVNNA